MTVLHKAIKKGNLGAVSTFLCFASTDVNKIDEHGYTPLHLAAKLNHPDIVRLLLLHPDIAANIKDDNGWTPLYLAVYYRHIDVVRVLLDHHDIDVNTTDDFDWAPLHVAIHDKNVDMLVALLSRCGININTADDAGRTPLHYACSRGILPIVTLLMQNKANPHCLDKQDQSPLMLASQHKNADTLTGIIKKFETVLETSSSVPSVSSANSTQVPRSDTLKRATRVGDSERLFTAKRPRIMHATPTPVIKMTTPLSQQTHFKQLLPYAQKQRTSKISKYSSESPTLYWTTKGYDRKKSTRRFAKTTPCADERDAEPFDGEEITLRW